MTLDTPLQSYREAVAAIAAHPGDFKGKVLVPPPFTPPAADTYRSTVRAILDSHPDFLTPRNKGLAVAWTVEPPTLPDRDVLPAAGEDNDTARETWANFLDRANQERLDHLERLRHGFSGWHVHADYTPDVCLFPDGALEARLKGHTVWNALCLRCPLNGLKQTRIPAHPSEHDDPMTNFSLADEDIEDQQGYPLQRGKGGSHACPALSQRGGPHGFRVMPTYMLWGDNRHPPHTANIIVLEDWPHSVKWWTGKQLQDASRPPYDSAKPLLERLSELMNCRKTVGNTELYEELITHINFDQLGTAWWASKSKRESIYKSSTVDSLPPNPARLVDAVLQDFTEWRAGKDGNATVFRSRVSIQSTRHHESRVVVRDPRGPVPDVFHRAAVIDLTGKAIGCENELNEQGIEVVTPGDVLAHVAQLPGNRRGARQDDKRKRVLEAITVLKDSSVKLARRKIAEHAGVHPSDLSRSPLRSVVDVALADIAKAERSEGAAA